MGIEQKNIFMEEALKKLFTLGPGNWKDPLSLFDSVPSGTEGEKRLVTAEDFEVKAVLIYFENGTWKVFTVPDETWMLKGKSLEDIQKIRRSEERVEKWLRG